jgi:hypothetical protein
VRGLTGFVRLSHGHRPTKSAVQIDSEMKQKTSWVATAALMGLPLVALAQANPAAPGAAAPALGYQSAFSDYKPWQDIKPIDWREVNDTVRDAKPSGGHDGHGASPALATPASAAPAPAPSRAAPAPQVPSGHSGHGDHK